MGNDPASQDGAIPKPVTASSSADLPGFAGPASRDRVLVCQRLDQSITVHYGPHTLGVYSADGVLQQAESKQRKRAAG